MNWWLLMIPVIGALIGWMMNAIAVQFLFHPRKPLHILGFRIQGILPAQQPAIAAKLGKMAGDELISFNDLEQKITSPESLHKVMPLVETHIDHFLRTKLSKAFPMISMFIGEKTINQLKEVFMEELKEIFPALMNGYMKNLQQDLDLEKIITEKLVTFPHEKLESIVSAAVSRKFGIWGALTGFLIGLVLLFIVMAAT